MADKLGAKAKIFIDDTANACMAMHGDTNSITLTRSKNNPETTTLGKVAVSRIEGIKDCTVDVTSVYDDGGSGSNVGGLLDDLFAASQVTRVQIAPAGSAASLVVYTGCFLVNNLAFNTPVDGVVTLNYSLALASGSLTAACQS
jgi:predicted secreted protein